MKTRFSLLLATLCGLASLVQLHGQSSAFTYQGRLTSGGGPANGSHDFQFTLFGTPSGGSPVDNPVTLSAVGVTNGVFTVQLNFGATVFTGQDRWLDIAVRPAGGGPFTPLNPRQPITPTPYALTALNALNVPGVDGHSLHAQDGSPANAVFVDNDGKVGVGTTGPVSRFHVASRPDEAAPPRLQSTGNTRFNAGWDFYHGGAAKGYVGVPDAGAPVAPGEMVLFGGANTKASLWAGQVRALTANTAGNVGIGTDTPAARLDVRGDIRLGPSGQFQAASGEESLRIVRGLINGEGQILTGSGFSVSKGSVGRYRVLFDPPFAGQPTMTASAHYFAGQGKKDVMTEGAQGSFATFVVHTTDSSSELVDSLFQFIAIGPR